MSRGKSAHRDGSDAWITGCAYRRVAQQAESDCGVACLAMVSASSYVQAHTTFCDLGSVRPAKGESFYPAHLVSFEPPCPAMALRAVIHLGRGGTR